MPADGSAIDPVNSNNLAPNKLIASDGAVSDFFGFSTAVNDKGVVLVGARYDEVGTQDTDSGSAYLYRPNGSGGYTQIKLRASDAAGGDSYGASVALNNAGIAVVGAMFDKTPEVKTGSVYVYRPDGLGGYFETKLVVPGLTKGAELGISVSINEHGVIAAGAAGQGGLLAGAVYVFTPDGFGGYTRAELTVSETAGSLGLPVVINDAGIVVAGAIRSALAGTDSGAVYVFTPDGTGGYTHVMLTASDGAAGDWFGVTLGLNASGTIVAGAPYHDLGTEADGGAVYVYQPDGQGGYVETRLAALDNFAGDLFGWRVAINDSGVIVAGAPGNDDAGANSGSAYVFVPDGHGGYTSFKLTAPDAAVSDHFGYSVSINNDGVVSVGGLYSDGSAVNSGAVYTFVPNADGNYTGSDGTIYTGVPDPETVNSLSLSAMDVLSEHDFSLSFASDGEVDLFDFSSSSENAQNYVERASMTSEADGWDGEAGISSPYDWVDVLADVHFVSQGEQLDGATVVLPQPWPDLS